MLAVTRPFHPDVTEVMAQFLEESAVLTIYHVVVLVNGQLLLAKILVVGLHDVVAYQTLLVVVLAIGHIGSPFMVFRDNLSAIQAFLEMRLVTLRVRLGPL